MTDATMLLRQVHPSWVQQGRVTSQAFRPTPKDKHLLSVYDGDLITAADSWTHFSGTLGFPSVGVMAVSVAECSTLDLPARPDPEPFPEHAVIDFSGLAENQIEKKGKRLKAKAEERGWLHQADRS